jgi:phenylpropionate dioxygenase-like ring-hydroxylating dioxygenase large terminal subunit
MNFNSHYTAVLTANLLLDKKPKQVFYNSKSVLLLRFDGKIRAYEDFCPHRGAPLSQGSFIDGQIHCPYHGWSFSFDDGKNTIVPVKNEAIHCELKKIHVLERYGLIWLCKIENGTHPNLLDEKPTIEISGDIKSLVHNSIENFLEGSHTHYIHEGLIRSHKTKRQFIKALFEPNEFGFKVHYEEEKPKGLITRLTPKKFQNLKSTATYIYPNLTVLEFFNQEDVLISRFEGIFSADRNNTKFFARIFLNFGSLTPFIKPFARYVFKKVIQQDIKILETQNCNLTIHQDSKFISDSTDLVGQQIFAWLYDADKILKQPTHFNLFW